MYTDLIIRQASVLDLETGAMELADLYLKGGQVREMAATLSRTARDELDGRGLILTPGLCDAHGHIFHDTGRGFIGLDPHRYHLPFGTTCVIDQGSAGADNYEVFRRHVLLRSDAMCKEILNCSRIGMYTDSLAGAGELEDLSWLDEEAFESAFRRDRENILGVKIRLTPNVCPGHPEEALARAAALARRLELPLVVHPNQAEVEDRVLFETLQAGDVYTHTYHDSDVGILAADGTVKTLVRQARERGVVFDTAHGLNSLAFPVLRAAMEQDFAPDTISTDLHNGNCNGPVFDLPTTISKFLCLGMPLHIALAKTITEPVRIWGLKEKCVRIEAGQTADLAAFRLDESGHTYMDAVGNVLEGKYRLLPAFTILRDRLYLPVK